MLAGRGGERIFFIFFSFFYNYGYTLGIRLLLSAGPGSFVILSISVISQMFIPGYYLCSYYCCSGVN